MMNQNGTPNGPTASPSALPRREGTGARHGEVNGVKFGVDSVKVDSTKVKFEGVK